MDYTGAMRTLFDTTTHSVLRSVRIAEIWPKRIDPQVLGVLVLTLCSELPLQAAEGQFPVDRRNSAVTKINSPAPAEIETVAAHSRSKRYFRFLSRWALGCRLQLTTEVA